MAGEPGQPRRLHPQFSARRQAPSKAGCTKTGETRGWPTIKREPATSIAKEIADAPSSASQKHAFNIKTNRLEPVEPIALNLIAHTGQPECQDEVGSFAKRVTKNLFGDAPPEGLASPQAIQLITGEKHRRHASAIIEAIIKHNGIPAIPTQLGYLRYVGFTATPKIFPNQQTAD
jgi:hypothetical protein